MTKFRSTLLLTQVRMWFHLLKEVFSLVPHNYAAGWLLFQKFSHHHSRLILHYIKVHKKHLHTYYFSKFLSQLHSYLGSSLFIICKWLVQKDFNIILPSFQNLFVVVWLLHEKECSFYSHLFCCTEMRWLFISSSAI